MEAAEFDRLDRQGTIKNLPRIAQLARELGYKYNPKTCFIEISPTRTSRHTFPPGWGVPEK
jgi:hypothetical protein